MQATIARLAERPNLWPWLLLTPLAVYLAVFFLVPLIDVIAVMLMTIAAPDAAFPLLWMFLAMWVGSSLGMLGVLAGTIVITAAYWFSYVVAGQQDDSRLIILPIVVAGLAAISSVASLRSSTRWRSAAERSSMLTTASVNQPRWPTMTSRGAASPRSMAICRQMLRSSRWFFFGSSVPTQTK